MRKEYLLDRFKSASHSIVLLGNWWFGRLNHSILASGATSCCTLKMLGLVGFVAGRIVVVETCGFVCRCGCLPHCFCAVVSKKDGAVAHFHGCRDELVLKLGRVHLRGVHLELLVLQKAAHEVVKVVVRGNPLVSRHLDRALVRSEDELANLSRGAQTQVARREDWAELLGDLARFQGLNPIHRQRDRRVAGIGPSLDSASRVHNRVDQRRDDVDRVVDGVDEHKDRHEHIRDDVAHPPENGFHASQETPDHREASTDCQHGLRSELRWVVRDVQQQAARHVFCCVLRIFLHEPPQQLDVFAKRFEKAGDLLDSYKRVADGVDDPFHRVGDVLGEIDDRVSRVVDNTLDRVLDSLLQREALVHLLLLLVLDLEVVPQRVVRMAQQVRRHGGIGGVGLEFGIRKGFLLLGEVDDNGANVVDVAGATA
jgi:hypothetical protein